MNCASAGTEVAEVLAYRTVLAGAERDGDHDVYRMLLDRQIDAVTFTSASTVRNFVQIFGAGAGRGSARVDGRGVDRAGDRRGGAAARHRDHRSCRSATRSRTLSTRSSSISRRVR